MAVASKDQDGKKWIQSSLAILCIFVGIIVQSFFEQLGEWFDLEAKIGHFSVVSQVVAVVIAFATFLILLKNKTSSGFLTGVYEETLKVVFPDKNQTVRHTIGIMIGVGIVGFLLGMFDFGASYILSLLH